MNIPKKVKVGGKFYTVKITDCLIGGTDNRAAEIDYRNNEIRIGHNETSRQHASFWHEIFHAIFDDLGYSEHDEKQVDELSNKLHALIVDNPKIFETKREKTEESE